MASHICSTFERLASIGLLLLACRISVGVSPAIRSAARGCGAPVECDG
jgi:hypothetical protein